MFLRNCWYVAAWTHELGADAPIAAAILDEPIVLYRRNDGTPVAMTDRCPHRHAPLSLGRIEDDDIRCGYHGLRFTSEGQCVEVPGSSVVPPNCQVRVYAVEERHSWLWIWTGDKDQADPDLIPQAFGLEDPRLHMMSDAIVYDAGYMLINDNLCDLSHVDFVHETTLGRATGGGWSSDVPRVVVRPRGIRIERWFVGKPASPTKADLVDTWSTYDYSVPGIFVMENKSYPHGAAERAGFGAPTEEPMTYRAEQQAVTPISRAKTRYLFASGIDSRIPDRLLTGFFDTVREAFVEDRTMIEAQQRVIERTSADEPMAFIVHDKGPTMFRKVLDRLIREEKPAAG